MSGVAGGDGASSSSMGEDAYRERNAKQGMRNINHYMPQGGYVPMAGRQGVVVDLTQGFGAPPLRPSDELFLTDTGGRGTTHHDYYRQRLRFPLETQRSVRTTDLVGQAPFNPRPPYRVTRQDLQCAGAGAAGWGLAAMF